MPHAISDEVRADLLLEIARTGRLAQSCKKVGINRSILLYWRSNDEDFGQLVLEALELYKEGLEEEAHRRAVDGCEEPIYSKGEVIGTVKKFSDRLLEILLKKNDPAYRESVKVDAQITGGVLLVTDPTADPNAWKDKHAGDVQKAPD